MEKIEVKEKLPDNYFDNLEKVGGDYDILYYDGPLISLFRKENKYYLFYWIDVDKKYNRWVVISDEDNRRFLSDIVDYMRNHLSLYDLLCNPSRSIYITDIDNDLKFHNISMLSDVSSLPDSYKPEKDAFFGDKLSEKDKNFIDYLIELILNEFNKITSEKFKEKLKSISKNGEEEKALKLFQLYKLYSEGKKVSERWKEELPTSLTTQDQKPEFEFNMPCYDIFYLRDVDRIIEYRGDKTLIHTEKGAMDLNSNSPEITQDLINGSIDVRRKRMIKKFGKFVGNIINKLEKFFFKKYRKSNE